MRTDLLKRIFRAENYDPMEPIIPRPPLVSTKPVPKTTDAHTANYLAEYAELAAVVGISAHDVSVENFKRFLAANNITIFSLPEVVSYMDKKAAAESKDKCGWEWRPLREKDNREGIHFGRKAERKSDQFGRDTGVVTTPGTDYYVGPQKAWNGHSGGEYMTVASSRPYDKTIPLHAIRKIALIEKEYRGDVAFFVCDYQPAPHIQYPDPFLMAVVVNDKLANGTGRFIIDFWDEPGFGLDKQLT